MAAAPALPCAAANRDDLPCMRPCVRCNGAPVYKKERGTYYGQPSYLYRHTHGAHGGMYWAFGYTRHSKAAEVCDPKNSANAKDFAGVF